MTDTAVPMLELSGVWVRAGGRVILENVNLRLADNNVYLALIGPNGGGKTTLLKVLLGLIKPEAGAVRLWGKPPADVRHRIGYVPQFSHFDPLFPITVFEVVSMGRLYHRKLFHRLTAADRDIVRRCLEIVGMTSMARRQTGRLSGGELQRVLIARALAVEPNLLLLDEPAASVDASTADKLYRTLADLNRTLPIIMVSHHLEVVSREATSIACLNRRLHYHGGKELTSEMIAETYHCPVDLIAHGVPHRVLRDHDEMR